MKRYNYKTRDLREADNEIIKFKEELDVLITSEEFIEKFRVYVEDIALYKRSGGIKYRRSTDYAATGVLDQNDLLQEAYLAFLEAYSNFKSKPESAFETGGELWAYLKKSTTLNYEKKVRGKKDGIKVPERERFGDAPTNFLTKMFGHLDKVFSNNAIEVSTSKWDTDLTGYFLEVHMDEVLDVKPNGKINHTGIERKIVKDFYGIDTIRKSSKEIANELNKGVGTIDVVRKRALDKLRTPKSKQKIAHFLHEYRIQTGANIGKKQ